MQLTKRFGQRDREASGTSIAKLRTSCARLQMSVKTCVAALCFEEEAGSPALLQESWQNVGCAWETKADSIINFSTQVFLRYLLNFTSPPLPLSHPPSFPSPPFFSISLFSDSSSRCFSPPLFLLSYLPFPHLPSYLFLNFFSLSFSFIIFLFHFFHLSYVFLCRIAMSMSALRILLLSTSALLALLPRTSRGALSYPYEDADLSPSYKSDVRATLRGLGLSADGKSWEICFFSSVFHQPRL